MQTIHSPNLIKKDLRIISFRSELLTDRYVSWLNDPHIVRYSEQRHRIHTLQSCLDYWEGIQDSNDLFLSIEVIEPSLCHIGNISISVDMPNRSADLSIMIGDKTMWGRGYGLSAWKMIISFLFSEVDFRRITAGTMEVNKPMLSIMQRSGMNIDCYRPRHFLWEGKEIAFIGASIFN